MANGHGGKRIPSNPAPVSGPGALSRRTDGQPARKVTGMPYGDNSDFLDLQQQAPMAQAPSLPARRRASAAPTAGTSGMDVTPMYAPTQRPDEPVTSGAALGPGPGVMPGPVAQNRLSNKLMMLAQYDDSGDLLMVADILAARGL